MGIYDRDYVRGRTSGGAFGIESLDLRSVSLWLIVILVGVFVLDALAGRQRAPTARELIEIERRGDWEKLDAYKTSRVQRALELSPQHVVRELQLWRMATFPLVHNSRAQLAFVVAVLLFIGMIVESQWDGWRFAALCVCCVVAAGSVHLLLWGLGKGSAGSGAPLLGSMTIALGVLGVATAHLPDMNVRTLFPFPLNLRVIAWAGLALLIVSVVHSSPNRWDILAPLSGAILGLAIAYAPQLLHTMPSMRRTPPRRRRRG